SAERQVDRRWWRERWRFRRFRVEASFDGSDRLGDQLRVHVQSDGSDLAALLRAKHIPRAANLQIPKCDLKTRAKLRRLKDDLQALLRRLAQGAVTVEQEVGVCAVRCPPHASAKLVEL